MDIYAKDSSSAAAYVYQSETPAGSVADFVTQANSAGQSGYLYRGEYAFGGALSAVYESSSSPASKWAYVSETPATSASAFTTLANQEGSSGYRYLGDLVFGSTTSSVFVRDSNASGNTFSYLLESSSNSSSDFVAQGNAEGESGGLYLGPVSFAGQAAQLYITLGAGECNLAFPSAY